MIHVKTASETALHKRISNYVLGSHFSGEPEAGEPIKLESAKEPVIYIGASPAASRLYKRAGFELVFTPEQTGNPHVSILRMKASELVKRFYNSNEVYRVHAH